jgi:hypothetical protein
MKERKKKVYVPVLCCVYCNNGGWNEWGKNRGMKKERESEEKMEAK